MTKGIDYFVQGHTGKGFKNLLESNLQGIKQVFVLGQASPSLINHICVSIYRLYPDDWNERIHCIDDKRFLSGLINRTKSFAIVSDRIYGGDVKNVIFISDQEERADQVLEQRSYDQAYSYFQKALTIHEQLEKIYIDEMDFVKADKVYEDLIDHLLEGVEARARKGIVFERFFGTNTAKGIVHYVESLIEPIRKKVFILGRAGTGKSFLMNKVLKACIDIGIDVEVYRCSLDPDSIDMLIIRALQVCIHDNTPPHVVATNYEEQLILDMFEETVNPSVEISQQLAIKSLQEIYKKYIQLGLLHLSKSQPNRTSKSTIDEKKVEQSHLDRILEWIEKDGI